MTKTYTINITRTKNTNADATLAVTGQNLGTIAGTNNQEYNLFLASGVNSIDLSASPVDSLATGISSNYGYSGIDTSTPGPKDILVTVTAQDASVTKTYKITAWCQGVNAQARVLDSVNGSILEGANLTLKVYNSVGTLTQTITSATYPQNLSLGAGAYSIVASYSGRAQSSVDNVSAGQKVALICQKLEQSSFPATSPVITRFAFTTDSDPTSETAAWTAINEGDTIDFSAATYVALDVNGTAVMEPTSWSGFGIELGLDVVPNTFSGQAALVLDQAYDSGTNLFNATAVFAMPTATQGYHKLCAVIYDRSNNRAERSLKVFNSSTTATGADLSTCTISTLLADFRIYGVTREYFSAEAGTDGFTPLSTGPVSGRVAVSFKVLTAGGANQAIRGFIVERCALPISDTTSTFVHFVQVGQVDYGTAGTGSAGTHTYYDTDPLLDQTTKYKYRVTAYTDLSHKKSATTASSVQFLPAFTTNLSSPATKSTVDLSTDGAPTLAFAISDASLWQVSVADRYYFAPMIKDKAGNIIFFGHFFYVFSATAPKLYFYYPAAGGNYPITALGGTTSDYFTYSGGTITLKPALFNSATNYYNSKDPVYASGVTYEWNIFGNYTGSGNLGASSAMTASYFQKSGTNTVTRSYTDVYQNGQDTLNGWYSFTVK